MFKTKEHEYKNLAEYLDTEKEDDNVYFNLSVMSETSKSPSPEFSEIIEAEESEKQLRDETPSFKSERKSYLSEVSLIIGGIICLWLITTRKD